MGHPLNVINNLIYVHLILADRGIYIYKEDPTLRLFGRHGKRPEVRYVVLIWNGMFEGEGALAVWLSDT